MLPAFEISRDGIPMVEHPVVEEYIKMYDNIVSFKDVLAKTFIERGILKSAWEAE